jgi:predicted nuclease of predicted toxin-antitoxin system
LDRAVEDHRVVLSADTDFGTLLAADAATAPSVLILRLRTPRRAGSIADLVLANIDVVAEDLAAGAVVVIEDLRDRVRRLPLR